MASQPRVRPALLAASFLRTAAAVPSHASGGVRSAAEVEARVGQHYDAEPYSAPIDTRILSQPLLLSSAAAGPLVSPSTGAAWLLGGGFGGGIAAPPPPREQRDVLLEVGAPFSLLRTLALPAGSWVELQACSASGSAAGRAVLARVWCVELQRQCYERRSGDSAREQEERAERTADGSKSGSSTASRSLLLAAPNAAAATPAAPSSPVLLLSPALHFQLFSAAAPSLSAPTDPALAFVRMRKFLPVIPLPPPSLAHAGAVLLTHDGAAASQQQSATPELMHSRLHERVLARIPTAESVTIARVRTLTSSAVERSRAGCGRLLAASLSASAAPNRSAHSFRGRVLYSGSDTLLPAPACLDLTARRSWLLRAPSDHIDDGGASTGGGDAMDEWGMDAEADEEGDDALADAEADPAISGLGAHFTPSRAVRLIFFRVTSVTPSFLAHSYFRIDPTITRVVQEGAVHSRVPYALECFLSNFTPPAAVVGERRAPAPASLQLHSHERATFAALYAFGHAALSLHARLQQSRPAQHVLTAAPAAALLLGPRRSHKRYLAGAFAAALGLHYVECNFFAMFSNPAAASGSEHAVVAELQRVVAAARAHAPCVLHVRRLGALKAWMSAQQKEHDSMVSAALQALLVTLARPAPAATGVSPSSSASAPVLVLASAEEESQLSSSLRSCFLSSFHLAPPGLEERTAIVRQALGGPLEEATAVEPEAASESGTALVKIDGEELEQAAAEVSSIERRSSLTKSPSPAPPTSGVDGDAAGTGEALTLSSLASLVAAKTAGMNTGDVEFLLSAASMGAVQRGMQIEAETKEKEAASASVAAAIPVASESKEEKEEKSDALVLASPTAAALAMLTPFASAPPAASHPRLQPLDVTAALAAWSARHSAQTGTLSSVPNVKWSDVGGLENVKREVMEAIELPLRFPHLFSAGIKKRAGLLLYGPPGTGKTLIAKAVATECGLNFMSVKGPELLNAYIGESERNIRDLFARARHAKPCVIFCDELDALAPNRGQGSDGGGVMDRVVSALLAELDGAAGVNDGVFIIAATNRPDLLDAGLLRPGRLDRCVYLGVSDTKPQQRNILAALTRKFKLEPDVDLDAVVARCPFTMSGADFYALASDALLYAIKRKIAVLENGLEAARAEQAAAKEAAASLSSSSFAVAAAAAELTPAQYLESLPASALQILVSQDDLLRSQRALKPSLDEEQLAHYKRLQRQFSENHSGGSGHESQPNVATAAPAALPALPESKTAPGAASSIAGGSGSAARATQLDAQKGSAHASATLPPPSPAQSTPTAASATDAGSAATEPASVFASPAQAQPAAPASSMGVRANPLLEWERGSSLRNSTSSSSSTSSGREEPRVAKSFSAYASAEPEAASTSSSSSVSASSVSAAAAAPSRPLKPWERKAAADAAAAAAVAAAVQAAEAAPSPSPSSTTAPSLSADAPTSTSLSSAARSTLKSFYHADPVQRADALLETSPSASASEAASSRGSSVEGSDAEVRQGVEEMRLDESAVRAEATDGLGPAEQLPSDAAVKTVEAGSDAAGTGSDGSSAHSAPNGNGLHAGAEEATAGANGKRRKQAANARGRK